MAYHQLPPLPYASDALVPHISKETLEYHHGKHHRAYVDKLNQLIAGTTFENCALETIVKQSNGAIFNNAAQAWNHDFYWHSLAPDGGGAPDGELAREINRRFGSFTAFREKFSTAATGIFGSGWAWLVRESGGLAICTTLNAQTPLTKDVQPLLACDVWEHAYYIDYRSSRPDYLTAFWALANWKFAARRYLSWQAPRLTAVG